MDPLSITASRLAIVTAAIQSIQSLKDTVNRFKDRNKTLARLQYELEGLADILSMLTDAIDNGMSTMALLEGPVSRCNQVCREFQNTMREFSGKSRVGLRDWTKMEFMRGNINDFIDTLASYKAEISLGLVTNNMSVSHLVSLVYN